MTKKYLVPVAVKVDSNSRMLCYTRNQRQKSVSSGYTTAHCSISPGVQPGAATKDGGTKNQLNVGAAMWFLVQNLVPMTIPVEWLGRYHLAKVGGLSRTEMTDNYTSREVSCCITLICCL